MAATVQVRIFTGASEGTGANAETGIKFNRDDTATGTSAPIPKPVATGTAFSWAKTLGLYVTAGGGSTTISNRRIRMSTSPATGLEMFFNAETTYAQATAVVAADTGSNGSDPAGYAPLTTSDQVYHATGEAATNADRNGDLCLTAIGVSNNYAGGAGTAIALPDLIFTYDEA
jgi:hypothetical protein